MAVQKERGREWKGQRQETEWQDRSRVSFSAWYAPKPRCARGEKDGPGVTYPGSRIAAASPAFPWKRVPQWPPAEPASGVQLPAYSGGTAWASHPLRMAAGQSRSTIGSRLVVPMTIARGFGPAGRRRTDSAWASVPHRAPDWLSLREVAGKMKCLHVLGAVPR
jgi:hypothetical protein